MAEQSRSWHRRLTSTGLFGAALAILVVSIIATIGKPLVGLGSLHAADTLQSVDPWRQSAPDRFRPDNGTMSDTVDAIAPVRLAVAQRARDGDLALWSSTQGGGAPALGVPNTAMLSPLSLPWWLAPAHAAPALAKALQMMIAALGLWLFARRLGASRAGATVGALAFVNAGHLVVWTSWAQSNVAALVPWLFWAVTRAFGMEQSGPASRALLRHSLARRSLTSRSLASRAWPVSVVGGAMWLEGFPALTLWAHVLAGTWILALVISEHQAARGTPAVALGHTVAFGHTVALGHTVARTTVSAVAAMGVGVAIAAVQLVPFLFRVDELALGAARQAKSLDALPWESISTLFFPRALGASGVGVWFGQRNEVELQAFVGMTALVLVSAAWVGRRNLDARVGWWRWSAGAIVGLGALIWVGPMNTVIQALPIIGGNQTGRLRGLLAFVVASLVALGFDAVRARVSPTRVALLCGVIVMALSPTLVRAGDLAAAAGQSSFFRQGVLWAGVVLAMALLVVLAQRKLPARAAAGALLLLPVLLALETTSFARDFLPRIDREDFYPRTEAHDVVAELVGSNRFAAGELALYPGTTTLYGVRSLTAHAAMPPGWRTAILDADPAAFDRSATFPILGVTQEIASSTALDELGVSHFVTSMDDPLLGDRDAAQSAADLLPDGRPLNGVEVNRSILDLLDQHDLPVSLSVRVLRSGQVVAHGQRRVNGRDQHEWLSVALSGSAVGGELEVALVLDPDRADADGTGALGVAAPDATLVRAVRVGQDGLTVVATPDVVVYERPSAKDRIRVENASGVVVTGRDAGRQISLDADDETVVHLDLSEAGTLVIADAGSRGHHATIDGQPAEVTINDGATIAVSVPSGEHTVRVWFEPEGIRTGAALTVLALLAIWTAARPPD